MIQHFKHGYKNDASIYRFRSNACDVFADLKQLLFRKNISVFFDVKILKKLKLNWNESKLTILLVTGGKEHAKLLYLIFFEYTVCNVNNK